MWPVRCDQRWLGVWPKGLEKSGVSRKAVTRPMWQDGARLVGQRWSEVKLSCKGQGQPNQVAGAANPGQSWAEWWGVAKWVRDWGQLGMVGMAWWRGQGRGRSSLRCLSTFSWGCVEAALTGVQKVAR